VNRDFICTCYDITDKYPDGTGELYSYADDPLQMRNLWDNDVYLLVRDRLLKTLDDNMPPRRAERLTRAFGA